MRCLWTFAAWLLLTAGCAGNTLRPGAANGERWLEVVTPNFVLHTDLHEPAARDTARSLEEMRAALLHMAWTGAREPPRGRIDVIVFRSPGEFNSHLDAGRTLSGVAFYRDGEHKRLGFHPGAGNGIPRVIIHELAHAVSAWFMPVQPSWFAEGLAGYLENTTYDRSTQVAVMGGLSKDYQDWLRNTEVVLRSEDLFAAVQPPHDGPYVSTFFYSSSWLLVHYLMNRESERFGEFQRRLARLQDWRSAWSAAFHGLSNEQLDQRVLAYARAADALTLSSRVTMAPLELQLRVLSPAEALGTRALLASLERPELARREALAALRLDPNELSALRVQFHALAASATAERLELAQRAVAAHPQRADAWWLLAQAHDTGSAAEAALQRAQQLEPEHPGVLARRARALLQQGNARAALPLTRLALRGGAASYQLLTLHLIALVALRECERALPLQSTLDAWLRERCPTEPAASCNQAREDLWQRVQPCAPAKPASGDSASSASAWALPGSRSASALPKAASATAPLSCIDGPLGTPPAGNVPASEAQPQKSATSAAGSATAMMGRLAPEVIRGVVRAAYDGFRQCYEAGLKRDSTLRGHVTVRFVIGRDGKASNVSIGEATLRDCDVINCVRAKFRQLRFPAPDGGIVTVSYPIQLEPG